MNTNMELLERRLFHLMGDLHFRSDFHNVIDSPDQLMAIGEYNTAQWEKVEAMGEEIQERIRNLFASIIADRLQKDAIERYGNTESSSIQQLLFDWFNRPEDQEFENRLIRVGKRALLGLDLTEEQCILLEHIYDKLPNMLMEYLWELVEPMHMLPRSEAKPIAITLADMIKELEQNDECR